MLEGLLGLWSDRVQGHGSGHTATYGTRDVRTGWVAVRHGHDTSGASGAQYKLGTNRITQHQPMLTNINRHLRRPLPSPTPKPWLGLSQRRYISKRSKVQPDHAFAGRAVSGMASYEDACVMRLGEQGVGIPPTSRKGYHTPAWGQSWAAAHVTDSSRTAPGWRAVGLRQVNGMPHKSPTVQDRS
jgi:hypothetical protein